MDPEVQAAIEAVNKAVADFQGAKAEMLKDMATKGHVDTLLNEKLAKLNANIDAKFDDYQAKAKALELRLNRMGPLGPGDGSEKDELKAALAYTRIITGQRNVQADLEGFRKYRAAFGEYLRVGDKKLSAAMMADMSVGSDPNGGYIVSPDMSGRIVTLSFETSPMRQICNVITTSKDRVEGINDLDEVDAGWIGELGTRSDSDTPVVGKYEIPVHEIYAQPRASQTLLDDADYDVEGWLNRKVADKFNRVENNAFINGDGIGKPRGLLSYSAGTPSAAAWEKIERILSGVDGAFQTPTGSPPVNGADRLIDVVTALKVAYRTNARWLMNRATWGDVRKLKDVDGRNLFSTQLTDGVLEFRLLGFPVVEAEDMPDINTDSLSIAFGDFREGYTIVDRTGIRLLRDPFTAKPWIRFYTTKRTGGAVVNFEAIKLMQFGDA